MLLFPFSGNGFAFPFPLNGALAENAHPGALVRAARSVCLRPEPPLSNVPIPLPRSMQPDETRFASPVSGAGTPAVADANGMYFKAVRRDEESS